MTETGMESEVTVAKVFLKEKAQWFRCRVASVFVLSFFAVSLSHAQLRLGNTQSEYERGMDMYESGMHEEAVPYLKSAAIKGNGLARQQLCFMYRSGMTDILDGSQTASWCGETVQQASSGEQKQVQGKSEPEKGDVLVVKAAPVPGKEEPSTAGKGGSETLGQVEAAALMNEDAVTAPVAGTPVMAVPSTVTEKMAAVEGKEEEEANGDAEKKKPAVPEKLETVEDYKVASRAGMPEAQYALGLMYEKGEGVKQSYYQARTLYMWASGKGFSPATYRIGLMYEQGLGVRASMPAALRWWKKAASMGNADAVERLKALDEQDAQLEAELKKAAQETGKAEENAMAGGIKEEEAAGQRILSGKPFSW